MKKILLILGISVATFILTTGCSSTMGSSSLEMPAHIGEGNQSTVKTAIYVGEANTKKMLAAIKAAGEKTGWRVTEFKSNAVIVEKFLKNKTISSTIKFDNGHIYGDHDNAPMEELFKLRKAIVAELKASAKAD